MAKGNSEHSRWMVDHAKGLWITAPGEDEPSITVIDLLIIPSVHTRAIWKAMPLLSPKIKT